MVIEFGTGSSINYVGNLSWAEILRLHQSFLLLIELLLHLAICVISAVLMEVITAGAAFLQN